MEETNNTSVETAKRPTFLTVLCILSFIAAGISIIGLIIGMGAKGAIASTDIDLNAAMEAQGAPSEAMSQMNAAFGWPNLIASIVLTIVSLVGVIMMWKLQKKGFFVYAAASVLGLIVPLIFGVSFSVFGAIIAILFIVLYGLNLKHLK